MSANNVDIDQEFSIDQMIRDMRDSVQASTVPDDAISKELDTSPIVYERHLVPQCEDKGLENNTNEDYSEVRQNLKQIIADGERAVSGLAKVASESESPRAYEVLGGYLKTLAEVNKQLIDLHETKAKIETEQAKAKSGGGTPITNNNVFVGSTEDLQRYLENQQK